MKRPAQELGLLSRSWGREGVTLLLPPPRSTFCWGHGGRPTPPPSSGTTSPASARGAWGGGPGVGGQRSGTPRASCARRGRGWGRAAKRADGGAQGSPRMGGGWGRPGSWAWGPWSPRCCFRGRPVTPWGRTYRHRVLHVRHGRGELAEVQLGAEDQRVHQVPALPPGLHAGRLPLGAVGEHGRVVLARGDALGRGA